MPKIATEQEEEEGQEALTLDQELDLVQANFEINLIDAERDYYGMMKEFMMVAAGIGGGFEDTHELHVTKIDEDLNFVDAEGWKATHDNVWGAMDVTSHNPLHQQINSDDSSNMNRDDGVNSSSSSSSSSRRKNGSSDGSSNNADKSHDGERNDRRVQSNKIRTVDCCVHTTTSTEQDSKSRSNPSSSILHDFAIVFLSDDAWDNPATPPMPTHLLARRTGRQVEYTSEVDLRHLQAQRAELHEEAMLTFAHVSGTNALTTLSPVVWDSGATLVVPLHHSDLVIHHDEYDGIASSDDGKTISPCDRSNCCPDQESEEDQINKKREREKGRNGNKKAHQRQFHIYLHSYLLHKSHDVMNNSSQQDTCMLLARMQFGIPAIDARRTLDNRVPTVHLWGAIDGAVPANMHTPSATALVMFQTTLSDKIFREIPSRTKGKIRNIIAHLEILMPTSAQLGLLKILTACTSERASQQHYEQNNDELHDQSLAVEHGETACLYYNTNPSATASETKNSKILLEWGREERNDPTNPPGEEPDFL